MKSRTPNILFVQYGDFKGAYLRLNAGGCETYRDQKSSVDFVKHLSRQANISVFSFSEHSYSEHLGSNLRAISHIYKNVNSKYISALFNETEPDFVVLRTPHLGFLKVASSQRKYILPNFADIFSDESMRSYYFNLKLRNILNTSNIKCYSNHNLNASLSMNTVLRLPPSSIVPWDWRRLKVHREPKSRFNKVEVFSVFFAGMVSEEKGVSDCLKAISILRKLGIDLSFSFAGPGDIAWWRARAEGLGIADRVRFLGVIPHKDVRREMRQHDAVIVPSRHCYPEGLPNTIYEALAARSPLIISDHPAFRGRLRNREECIMFLAGNPIDLAEKISDLARDTSLYQKLSVNSESAHDKLYIGMEWQDLIENFLEDPTDKSGWVEKNSLKLYI